MSLQKRFRYFVLIVSAIVFVSCSDNDKTLNLAKRPVVSEPIARGLQIKKITQSTYVTSMNTDISVTDFIYSGNKLIGTHGQDENSYSDAQIIYNGNKISQIISQRNGSTQVQNDLFYGGIFLTSLENQYERTEFTYDSNGNVQSKKQFYLNPDQGTEQLASTINYTYQNGNVVQEERTDLQFGNSTTFLNYIYDDKINPTKGMNKYFRLIFQSEGFNGLSSNNPISRSYYQDGNQNSPTVQTYQLEYNTQNYPIRIKRFSENNTLISDTLIEYR